MADELFQVEEEELHVEVAEMATDASAVIPLDTNRVQQLLAATKDEAPEFPIIRVEPGLSENGNNWPESVLVDVAEQVNRNEPVGYLGHIPPDQRGFAFPDPQTIWLKAVTKNEQGKKVLYVKGYNFPGEKIRVLLATGAVKTTSWSGKATGKVIGGVRQIEKFALESIDWSRKGSQGMRAELVGLANEMEGSDNDVEWAKATLADVERENPSLFAQMRDKITAENAERITEMEEKAEQADEGNKVFAKLREVLGIDEKADIVQAVADVQEKVDNLSATTLKEKIGEVLTSKLKKESSKKAVLRVLTGTPEIVTEMEGASDDDLAKLVDQYMTDNDEIKEIVTEMEAAPAPLGGHRENGGKGEGSKVGASGMVRTGVAKL